MRLISFINVAIDGIRASRERREKKEIGKRVRDVGRLVHVTDKEGQHIAR